MKISFIKKMAVLAAVASVTSGCAMYRLQELRQATPTGTPFQKELAKLYMGLATQDEKGYDWFNSWYFADKGLRSAYGKDVAPEDLKNWNIPRDILPDLQKAHGDLLIMLTPQNEAAHPQLAAQAQFYFDCWVQRQDENWQIDRINYCRSGFIAAMASLSAPAAEETERSPEAVTASEMAAPKAKHKHKHKAAAESKASSAKHAEKKPAKGQTAETLSYVVFFADSQPVITGPGAQVINDITKSLNGIKDYEIILKSGAGSDAKSALFAQRAAAITKQLVAGGITSDAIATGKGKGAAAKRVEIFISQ